MPFFQPTLGPGHFQVLPPSCADYIEPDIERLTLGHVSVYVSLSTLDADAYWSQRPSTWVYCYHPNPHQTVPLPPPLLFTLYAPVFKNPDQVAQCIRLFNRHPEPVLFEMGVLGTHTLTVPILPPCIFDFLLLGNTEINARLEAEWDLLTDSLDWTRPFTYLPQLSRLNQCTDDVDQFREASGVNTGIDPHCVQRGYIKALEDLKLI
jgi:hypothetical protein